MPKAAQDLPNKISELDKGITLEILQCSNCGLVQLKNKEVPYYKEVIRAVGISDKMKSFRLKQFSDFIEKYNLYGAKILEVGCGQGEYLDVMKECGTITYGLEYSDQKNPNIHLKHNIKKGYIDKNWKSPFNENFDAFYILNFLEHMPDPNSMFIGIKKCLKEGGIGLVEVPNFDMNIRNNLFTEFISDHLFYFTKDSLSTLFKINGFEILNMEEVWHGYMISSIIKKREPLELSAFRGCELKLKEDIHEYIKKYNKIAIWGAGHQALTVFSITNLKNKISYVVDSAPFKQGKYTPVTHIPIVSPNTLLENPVDAIIVIAGGYSDSVVAKIRKLTPNIKIAILDNYRVKDL